jgi:hypothetical protein
VVRMRMRVYILEVQQVITTSLIFSFFVCSIVLFVVGNSDILVSGSRVWKNREMLPEE